MAGAGVLLTWRGPSERRVDAHKFLVPAGASWFPADDLVARA